jgi:acyl-CoA synthetase (AMP-forming)/AMP-acid ligase II/acyl carrier protein
VNGILPESLTSIVDLLEQRAALHPDSHAFSFLKDGTVEVDRLTYSQLRSKVVALAAHFQSVGLVNKAALLLYPPGLEFIVAFYACLYARVTAIPAVPPSVNRHLVNLDAITIDAGADAILTSAGAISKLEALYALHESARSYQFVVTDSIPDARATWQAMPVGRSDIAFLQYTSGSTGAPKGVMVGHGNLLHNHEMLRQFFEIDASSVYVSWLPHHHDMGLIGQIMESVYVGVPCILLAPATFVKRPYAWLKAISDWRGTISGSPNFGYQLCVDRLSDKQVASLDLSSWRVAFNGAEPVRRATLTAFQERFAPSGLSRSALFPCYGMAEATLIISGGQVSEPPASAFVDRGELEKDRVIFVPESDPAAHALVCCGSARCGQELRIVDPVTGEPRGADQVGEIWVSGGSICHGYFGKPDVSASVFSARLNDAPERSFARCGDLGFLDEQGRLYITGRLKDVIIVRGRNVYPQDIEMAVEQCHPALASGGGAAFSIVVDDEERVVVAHEASRGYATRFDLQEIVAAITRVLAEIFELQLHAFVLLRPGRVPKTSSGKIQRSRARREYLAQELEALASWERSAATVDIEVSAPPVIIDLHDPDHVESWLRGRLTGYLRMSPREIDRDSPMAHYGLDSAAALKLAADISRLTQREVEPTLLWECPTLSSLASRIARSSIEIRSAG